MPALTTPGSDPPVDVLSVVKASSYWTVDKAGLRSLTEVNAVAALNKLVADNQQQLLSSITR